MQFKFHFLFLSVSLLLLPITSSALGSRLGGWQPIKDLGDAHVKEIAEFAVSQHNKQSDANLKLDRIVKGEKQVVSGIIYRLTLAVNNGGAGSKNYVATVWEKAWEKFLQLSSFEPAQ